VRQAARLKYIPQSNVSNWLDKKTKHPKKFQLCRFPDVSATARKKENGNMFDVKLESVGRFFFSQTFGYRNVRWRDAIQLNALKHSFVPPDRKIYDSTPII
jgi:hypothetical protein